MTDPHAAPMSLREIEQQYGRLNKYDYGYPEADAVRQLVALVREAERIFLEDVYCAPPCELDNASARPCSICAWLAKVEE